ncbi:hypothetical protein E1262_25070 [Jiangella aurantiaca]|uniref:Uncharacterized protein n=1 Tax=Jiangella aurantiaca TaxID=2530373 RepID=A0A4R5A200_9ACTN|nr:hypothetical protein [Jiangella aurantiaca]TDD65455.1 hypothetical protein E1262_25070 [Jiangella aurantiaca]
MSDPVAELNQLLYTATPAERRAILRAALPFVARWLVESVDSSTEENDPEWPLTVSADLLVPLDAAVRRVQTGSPRVPRQDCHAPTAPA